MDNKLKELCEYRLNNARDSLKVAEICIESKKYREAINRCYYAAFYAVKSVLALESVDFKRHKDVVAYFNQNYVATGLFSKELVKKISKLKRMREKGDYEDFYIVSRDEAITQKEAAEDIINNVIKYLKDKIEINYTGGQHEF